jgi:hypothetical protein
MAFGWIGATIRVGQPGAGAISAHLKTYVNPNRKKFATNRAFAAAENVKISSES